MTSLTKADLRTIYSTLARSLPPANPPTTPEELVEITRVRDVVQLLIEEHRADVCRGQKVFEWRLPREQAPSLNSYAFMKTWARKRLRLEHDDQLRALLQAWPAAPLHGARRKRWVRATRFSRNKVDDTSIDVLGGKMPVDALVRADVLHDDSQTWLVREALLRSTQNGNTHLLVEVFEVADEAIACDDPKDERVTQVIRKRGKLTRAITGEASSTDRAGDTPRSPGARGSLVVTRARKANVARDT